MNFADVILPLPLDGTFTYSIPQQWQQQVKIGIRVLVPFGRNKQYVGIVANSHDRQPEGYEVKDILQPMDTQPILLPQQLKLWQWIADYYMSPVGEVYKAALPAGLKAEDGYRPKTETYIRLTEPYRNETALHVALNMLQRATKQLKAFTDYLALSGWDHGMGGELTRDELLNEGHTLQTIGLLIKRGILETYEVEVGRLNHGGEPHPENIKKLSPIQEKAYNEILFSLLKKNVTLLHGVTSSGKTEIYIHLIQREIDQHRQVLYLLPEIALTVQMMERLHRVFGDRLGIYHSKYSDAERVEIWRKQLSGHPYDVILGARSAVFLPFQNLGLVIIDEEHETSFKQQDPMPRYHARSVAIMLGSKVLLGTATPSMESYHNARTGKYGLVELTGRHEGIDFKYKLDADIYSLTDGTVLRVAIGSPGSGGLSTIAIYNKDTDKTVVYLHAAPSVQAGDKVHKGDKIGKESWRGISSKSSSHTHVEVRDGKQEYAAKSVGDPKLQNDNPSSFWKSLGYSIK